MASPLIIQLLSLSLRKLAASKVGSPEVRGLQKLALSIAFKDEGGFYRRELEEIAYSNDI